MWSNDDTCMIQNVESNSIQYKLVHTLFTGLTNHVTKVFDMVERDQPYGDKYIKWYYTNDSVKLAHL